MRLLSVLLLAASSLAALPSELDPEWIYVPGGLPVVTPVIGEDGSVYLLCEDRYLYRLDESGRLLWRANLRRRPVHGAVGSDGLFVAALETGEVVGVAPSGGIVFRTDRRYETPYAPALGFEGLLTVAYPSGRLESRNRSGRLLWSATVVDGISAAPIVVGGVTVLGTRGGRLIGLDRFGSPLWEVWLGTEATALAAAGPTRLIVGTAEGRILSVGTSGSTHWEVFTNAAVAALRVGPDRVIYATEDGEVGGISMSGRIESVDTLADPPRDIFYTTSGVIILEAQGRLRSLESVLVRELEGVRLHSVALAHDGAMVAAAPSWEVALFPVDLLPVGAWPTAGGGPSRPGRSTDRRDLDQPSRRYASSLDYLFLRDLMTSPFAAEVEQALDEMLEKAGSSQLRGRHGYYRDLTGRLLGASVQRLSRGVATVTLPASARMKAIRLLGILGDAESRRILLEFSRYEVSDAVLARYVESFGAVVSDVDGGLLRRVAEIVLMTESALVGREAVVALEVLGRYHGYSQFWQSVVMRLVAGPYGESVAADASALLGTAEDVSN